MPSSDSDAQKILARGAPITLTDGRVFHIRYGFLGLRELEERFGSTQGIDDAIATITRAEGKAYTQLAHFIVAGLIEQEEFTSDQQVLALLDPRQMLEYGSAIGQALAEAFPDAVENGDGGKAPAPRKVSRGRTGTTPPPSSSDDQKTPSGT